MIDNLLNIFLSHILLFLQNTYKYLKEYISNQHINRQVEKLFQISVLINKKYKDAYCLFSASGIGDVFYIAGQLHEFRKNNPGRIVWFVCKKSIAEFLTAYSDVVDEVVYDPEMKILEGQLLDKKISKGVLNLLFFPYWGSLPTYTFSDNYSNMLGVPLTTRKETPLIMTKNKAYAKKIFDQFGIEPSRTILLIPDSTMFDSRYIEKGFWLSLTDALEHAGYEIIINTQEKIFSGRKKIFPSINELISIATRVKSIICIRSGITDILCYKDCKQIFVVYPPRLEMIWKDQGYISFLHSNHAEKRIYPHDFIFKIHSLGNISVDENIVELIYNYNNEEIIGKIIKKLTTQKRKKNAYSDFLCSE